MLVSIEEIRILEESYARSPSVFLRPRQICDLELLLNGGFAPLAGFLDQKDYDSVLEPMRLEDGTLWPIPIVLDVPDSLAVTL